MTEIPPNPSGELERLGFTVARDVLAPSWISPLEETCERLAAQLDEKARRAHVSTGSLIRLWSDPLFADLIAAPEALALFRELGFARPRFSNGYILRKPPRSPPLFWHQDWWAYNEPISDTDQPAQVGLLYYLGGASEKNGALRVLPGSHRRPPRALAERDPDIAALRRLDDPDALEHQPFEGEQTIAVGPRDAALIDARLYHAAHANRSDRPRIALTLWYFPSYDELPESLRATIGTTAPPEDWPESARAKIAPLLPRYTGTLAPKPYVTRR